MGADDLIWLVHVSEIEIGAVACIYMYLPWVRVAQKRARAARRTKSVRDVSMLRTQQDCDFTAN